MCYLFYFFFVAPPVGLRLFKPSLYVTGTCSMPPKYFTNLVWSSVKTCIRPMIFELTNTRATAIIIRIHHGELSMMIDLTLIGHVPWKSLPMTFFSFPPMTLCKLDATVIPMKP